MTQALKLTHLLYIDVEKIVTAYTRKDLFSDIVSHCMPLFLFLAHQIPI